MTAMEFLYDLVTEDTPRHRAILQETIFLLVPSLNPDGVDKVTQWYRRWLGTPYEGAPMVELYHKYVGHDNNRDWYMFTQAETRLTVEKVQNVWRPQIVYDIHQMGTTGARIFVPPWADPVDPSEEFLFIHVMAGLTRPVNVQQRAADPVVGNLGGAVAHIRHVAVGTGHPGPRVDALRPQFKLGVLGFEDFGAALGVLVIIETRSVGQLHIVPEFLGVLDLQSVAPREGQRKGAAAVIFDVTLRAHKRPHLGARGHRVGIVGPVAARLAPAFDRRQVRHRRVRRGETLDPVDKSGTRHAQLHRFGVVAVHTGNRMRAAFHLVQHGVQLLVRNLVGLIETGHGVAVT